jgi:hypothetical protein
LPGKAGCAPGAECAVEQTAIWSIVMSKGMDQKKSEKKTPEKSLKEKRAAKKDKKAGK